MRFGTRFRCPECLTESRSNAMCASCRVPVEQLESVERPVAKVGRIDRPWLLRRIASSVGMLVIVTTGAVAVVALAHGHREIGQLACALFATAVVNFGGIALLAYWLDAPRHGALVRAAQRRPRLETSAIATLRAGQLARVVGRVRLVDAVPDADGRQCAAWAKRAPRLGDAFEGGGCGRFAVEDDCGAIGVDDDCFVIDDGGRGKHAVVGSGDRVEVTGRVVQTSSPSPAAMIAPGLRDAGQSFAFDGTPEMPIVIRILERAR